MSLTETEVLVRDYFNEYLQNEQKKLLEAFGEELDRRHDGNEKAVESPFKFSRKNKTEPVKFYVSWDDAMRIQSRANTLGLAVSAYMRFLVMKDLDLND